MMNANDIELFKNLSQEEYNGKYFDFHNDYDCVKVILFVDGFLTLIFRNIVNKQMVKLKFSDVTISTMDFFNFNKVENLTIDNLYRGKAELEGELVELKNGNIGYFFLEFDEGQKLEFWSSGVEVE
ncbi:MAG: hypothetical protein KA952_04035 [Sediminibacterium sp.]|nr:hypothetical protein [Sediminibacterium sp.]